ncbi:hypothetical protein Scep_027839 [Stephania cephalantha]|uniref:Uncharacterized protein n=1 Tax=Stephania cephalantha TaxID=152367 RepID=A0AAP0EDC9_9MAGN
MLRQFEKKTGHENDGKALRKPLATKATRKSAPATGGVKNASLPTTSLSETVLRNNGAPTQAVVAWAARAAVDASNHQLAAKENAAASARGADWQARRLAAAWNG